MTTRSDPGVAPLGPSGRDAIHMTRLTVEERILGGLLGSAVGDALGMPMECHSYAKNVERFGEFQSFAHSGFPGWGGVTDDTTLGDYLIDCILACEGRLTAYGFARDLDLLEKPVEVAGGNPFVRMDNLHYIMRITVLRNRLLSVPKRELGHGESDCTDAIMMIAPVGLLCAGDPLKAELMAVDVASVIQQGGCRDVAAAYAAAIAACFIPDISPDEVVETAIAHIRHAAHTREVRAIVELAKACTSCGQFSQRYWREIVGPIVPLQDEQHHGTPHLVTWNPSEVLGVALGCFLITGGRDGRATILGSALNGRDADTTARVAGGLIGTYRGPAAIPTEWGEHVLRCNPWLRLEEKAARLAAVTRKVMAEEVRARSAVL